MYYGSGVHMLSWSIIADQSNTSIVSESLHSSVNCHMYLPIYHSYTIYLLATSTLE